MITRMEFDTTQTGPASFPVAVLIKRRPSTNRWLKHSWSVVAVVVNSQAQAQAATGLKIREDDDGSADYLWGGLAVQLYKDEAESYYFNLLTDKPSLYVITRNNSEGEPEPFLVSPSFDEANAYVESEEDAYPVPLPPELYNWIERFVLTHYKPEPRTKRKRKNWKEEGRERR